MPLDRSKVQERLNALQSKGRTTSFEKKDYTKIYWKPRLGEQTVRLVPFKDNPNYPLQQVKFHKDIVVMSMYSLSNWGEKDPIEEFIEAIKLEARAKKAAGENSDEEWSLAKKLRPKTRTYAQVIVRGEEHLGTRLWEFGNKVEEQILKIVNNPEYGDIADPNEGTDLLVTGINAEFNGNKYIEPSVTAKRNSSPLTTDAALLQKLLTEQYDPLSLYKKNTYAEIHANLSKWLEPEEPQSVQVPVDEPAPADDINDLPFSEPYTTEVHTPPVTSVTTDKPKRTTTKKPLVNEGPAVTTKNKFKDMFNKP
jgi:hypothetical protein